MKLLKKLTLLAVVAALLCSLTLASAESEWKWERDIEIVCTFDVGSGTDTTLRAMNLQLGRHLGTNVIINNVSGASGVNGAEFFNQQPRDGYTFAMFTPSHVIAGLRGATSFDILNDVRPVHTLVQDSNVIFSNPNLPFTDVEGMIAYAKENPGKLTLTLQSVTGIDAASAKQFLDATDIDVTMVQSDGAEAYSLVIGGHASLTLGSFADAEEYIKGGLVVPLVCLSPEPSTAHPDVPTAISLGYDCTLGPWRMIVAMDGTPQAAIDSLEKAISEVCSTDEKWMEFKEINGLDDREGFFNQEESTKLWKEYVDLIKPYI
jgi:putative tricarboxylic transport membrane protein